MNNDFSTRKDSYQSPHLGSIYPRFITKDNVLTPDYNYINGNYPLMFGRNLTHNLGVNNFSISGLKNNMSELNNSTFSSSLHFWPGFGFNTNKMMFNALNNNQLYPNIQNFELDGGSMLSRQYSQTSIFSDTYNNKSSKSINSDRSYYNQSFGFNTNNYNNKNNLSVRSFGRASYFDEYRSNNIFNIGNNSLNLNLNMNRSYISPRNVSELNFKNLNTSEDKQNINGIPTILKKIVDWEKKKD